MKYLVQIGDSPEEIEITEGDNGLYNLKLGDQVYAVDLQQIGREPLYSIIVDGQSHQFYADIGPTTVEMLVEGALFTIGVLPHTAAAASLPQAAGALGGGHLQIKAPMPGVINDVYVQPEQSVERGERLLLLEAMKMNNEVRAPRSGVVQEVRIAKGQRVNKDDVLVTLDEVHLLN